MNQKISFKHCTVGVLLLLFLLQSADSFAEVKLRPEQKSEFSVVALVGGPWLDTFVCSGVLLSGKIVLTAAHCVCLREPSAIFYGLNVYSDLAPNKGPDKTGDSSSSWGWENISAIHDWSLHPETSCKKIQQGDFGVDLALIKIREDWEYFDMSIDIPKFEKLNRILNVPRNEKNELGKFKGISFGVTSRSDQPGLRHLYEVELAHCDSKNALELGCTPSLDFVSITDNGVDTCLGDSGGPVYNWSVDGPILVAITSRGRRDGGKLCGSGGVYTSIATEITLDWIKETTGAQ